MANKRPRIGNSTSKEEQLEEDEDSFISRYPNSFAAEYASRDPSEQKKLNAIAYRKILQKVLEKNLRNGTIISHNFQWDNIDSEASLSSQAASQAIGQSSRQSNDIGEEQQGYGTSSHDSNLDSDSQDSSGRSTQDASTKRTPFDQETTVFENDFLKIYIFRKDFDRQKKFSFDDHLFLLKVETLKGKPPLLLDIEDILNTACEDILTKIKAFYKQGNFLSL
jgi:hypothetical protein